MSGDDAIKARIAGAKADGTFTALADAIPYARFLGLSLALDEHGVVGRLAYAPRNIGNSALPALHGGTIGALLEFTATFQLLWQGDTGVLPKTISLTIEYLRTGRPLETFARARLVRQGRRVAPLRIEAWQDDPSKPIAAATAQFLLID
jgi:acyl-coenzyme A thioesterase PaaI-like protein